MGRKCIDLTGQKFGRLTVVEKTERPVNVKNKDSYWLCECDCGTMKIVKSSALKYGSVTSCGCFKKELDMKLGEGKGKDLTGIRFGRLTVIEKSDERDKNGSIYWLCQCDCGTITSISSSLLTRGKTQSCGCLHKEKCSERAKQQFKGKDNHNYKGGITPITNHLRSMQVIKQWKKDTYTRENSKCQLTGKHVHGGNSDVHHLYGFSMIVEDSHKFNNIEVKPQVKDYTEQELKLLEDYVASWHINIKNAVVLSEEVHRLFHQEYGYGENTPEQYMEFKERYLAGEFKEILK